LSSKWTLDAGERPSSRRRQPLTWRRTAAAPGGWRARTVLPTIVGRAAQEGRTSPARPESRTGRAREPGEQGARAGAHPGPDGLHERARAVVVEARSTSRPAAREEAGDAGGGGAAGVLHGAPDAESSTARTLACRLSAFRVECARARICSPRSRPTREFVTRASPRGVRRRRREDRSRRTSCTRRNGRRGGVGADFAYPAGAALAQRLGRDPRCSVSRTGAPRKARAPAVLR